MSSKPSNLKTLLWGVGGDRGLFSLPSTRSEHLCWCKGICLILRHLQALLLYFHSSQNVPTGNAGSECHSPNPSLAFWSPADPLGPSFSHHLLTRVLVRNTAGTVYNITYFPYLGTINYLIDDKDVLEGAEDMLDPPYVCALCGCGRDQYLGTATGEKNNKRKRGDS